MRVLRVCFAVSLSLVLVTSVVAQQTATPTIQRDPQALSILSQSLSAMGSSSALSAIQDFTATGNITYFWAGQEVSGAVTVKARGTNEFRMDAALSAGTRSWIVSPTEASIKNVDGTVSPIPPVNTRNLAALSLPQLRVATAFNNTAYSIQYGGLTTVGGRQTHVVKLQQVFPTSDDPDGFLSHLTAAEVLIDATSYQVVLVRDWIHPPNHTRVDLAHEIAFSNYQLSNGYLVPLSFTESVNGQQTWTIQLTSISFNTGLTGADFIL